MSLVNDEGEPLTATDFVRSLSSALEGRVWAETSEPRCGRGCCGTRIFTACSDCGAEEGDYGEPSFRQHKDGCRLNQLLQQADAFLAAEDRLQLEQDRGSEEAVPHHPA